MLPETTNLFAATDRLHGCLESVAGVRIDLCVVAEFIDLSDHAFSHRQIPGEMNNPIRLALLRLPVHQKARGIQNHRLPQERPLGVDALSAMGVGAANDLGDEGAIGVEIVEVGRAAKRERVGDGALPAQTGTPGSRGPAVMREPEEVERLGTPLASLLPACDRMPAELDEPRLVRMEVERERS